MSSCNGDDGVPQGCTTRMQWVNPFILAVLHKKLDKGGQVIAKVSTPVVSHASSVSIPTAKASRAFVLTAGLLWSLRCPFEGRRRVNGKRVHFAFLI